MKSNTKKRLIAFMLCMVLVLSSATSAFADEGSFYHVPNDTVELSREIMKDGISQGTLYATIPGEAFQASDANANLQMDLQTETDESAIIENIQTELINSGITEYALNQTIMADISFFISTEVNAQVPTKPINFRFENTSLDTTLAMGFVYDRSDNTTTGDVINYTITQSYPYYPANAKEPTFTIVDTITNATFNQDSLVVKAGTNTLVKGPDKDYTVDFNENKMTITFNYDSAKAGQIVTVKYGVTVADISNIDTAKVTNSATATANGKYTVAEVESAAVTFTVKKVDASDNKDNKTGLSGAEFQLYVSCTEGTSGAQQLTLKNNSTVWALSLGKTQKKTTDDNGNATFKGLDADKTYYVLETKAPAGYSLNDKAIQLTGAKVEKKQTSSSTLKDENNIEYTKETTSVTVTNFKDETYTDTKLNALPSTGGIGTTIFTIAGCVIMIAAAGLFFASRKKSDNK